MAEQVGEGGSPLETKHVGKDEHPLEIVGNEGDTPQAAEHEGRIPLVAGVEGSLEAGDEDGNPLAAEHEGGIPLPAGGEGETPLEVGGGEGGIPLEAGQVK